MIPLKDPTVELLNRKREMDTLSVFSAMDEKELKERQEAARAYSGENEQHFVEYAQDCINQTVKANRDIRRVQSDCWNVYNENEPVSYADKEEWQARIVVPKPFETVQFGASAVKKAFSPNFLSIENTKNEGAKQFWQKVMDLQLNDRHAKFISRFADAVTMGLAVGQSQEMIPMFVKGKGLQFELIEPWKIHRDPDAPSRDSQGGMYWIHQEWLDYFVLKAGEKKGRYFDVARVKEVNQSNNPEDPFLTKEAVAARKAQTWERSKFRKAILTSEFWGIVLDPKGEVLLPRATYTIAGGRVIQKPKASPYRTLRWPGVSFSALPDLLRFGGRGLLEGILSVWEAMNQLMCLHQDYLQWIVNPPNEINVDGLVDPDDVELIPGKDFLTRDTQSGQQVVRTVQRKSRTNDILSNSQHYDQLYQRGSFVTDGVQGLPGYRKDMTYRESAMNLDQAQGPFGLMGENIEVGAKGAISAGMEVIEAQAGWDDYLEVFSEEELMEMGMAPNSEDARGVAGVPVLDGTFSVSGMQALMKEAESLKTIREIMIPLAQEGRFAKYILPYPILTALIERTKLTDENIIVTEDQATAIDEAETKSQEEAADAAEEDRELEQTRGLAEIVTKMDSGDKGLD